MFRREASHLMRSDWDAAVFVKLGVIMAIAHTLLVGYGFAVPSTAELENR